MTEDTLGTIQTTILPRIAAEAGVTARQAAAVVKLFAEGNTVPFIARYRKEAHGNLDEVQILKIKERLDYHTDLETRKLAILKSIDEQGKLDDALAAKIRACTVKSTLEDLYAPFKPKRRTRAMIAKEKGLEPLADAVRDGDAAAIAAASEEDLAGARDILAERIADNADIRGYVRTTFAQQGVYKSEVFPTKKTEGAKYEQYFDHEEPLAQMPSHRFLAIRRGQTEGFLFARLVVDKAPVLARIGEIVARPDGENWRGAAVPAAAAQIRLAVEDAYKRLLAPSCEIDVTIEKKNEADRGAVEVFAENLRHLLLAAPLGEKAVLAIDPGIRTGCKVAMMDATGKFLGNTVIYPMQKPEEAAAAIRHVVAKANPAAIAVGNGTAGRETEAFARRTLKDMGRTDVMVVSVSEAGASVYSASEVARDEFPQLDLTVRGAISIGRRLQDPLAELVKIDPKSIGVGQYQHDVSQTLLGDKLIETVESCVNSVGVELNTASAQLLERVSGVGRTLAKNIVKWRDANGAFRSRKDLLKVEKLGPKAYEQCAGFLRIRGAENPLDASAVHPERYALVERMAADLGTAVKDLVGNPLLAKRIDLDRYVTEDVGLPTLKDIVAELVKPGRDPRAVFEKPAFREDVMTIEDVKEGMELEGVVTNVAAFGAFVDIGIHQDGLVHVSELADRYIRDPSEAVKVGDRIKVKVIGVDKARNRVSLTARKGPRPAAGAPRPGVRPAPRRDYSTSGFTCNPFANL